MARQFNIAIAGATGIVGQELLAILSERRFPVKNLKLLASEKSAGEKHEFRDQELTVETLNEKSFESIDIAFLALDNNLAKQAHDWAKASSCVCIDKSSAFRTDPEVPLVVPEVNPEAVSGYKSKNIIASPNCTTAPLVQILKPLHEAFGLESVVLASYQAVSGAGKAGVAELEQQTRDMFNLREVENAFFSNRIAFNLIPYIEGEEEKLIQETRKILNLPELKISATCVRVPVFNGHSAAFHMSFKNKIDPQKAKDLLASSKGLQLRDDLSQNLYPMPTEASGGDDTLVGRIRQDASFKNGLAAFYASDNIRTGAALNAVKIAEVLVSEYLK